MTLQLPVLVQTPAHSNLGGALSYESDTAHPPGTLVRVPLGQREILGIVWDTLEEAPALDPGVRLRSIAAPLDGVAPLTAAWRQLVQFAAQYYQRSAGEVALAALPPQLRELTGEQMARRLKKHQGASADKSSSTTEKSSLVALTTEQQQVLGAMADRTGPFLLFGNTGSGKTEVYLRRVEALLSQDAEAQALLMVPEINLTPQLEARVRERFQHWGEEAIVSMHSGMTPAQRLRSWLLAHTGRARIVLGTRMAIFASLPQLRLIVVDEEHDPSYKQQEGARYSARDLAVYRGRLEQAQVILGSATPSLESWHQSRPATDTDRGGRYIRLNMPSRIGAGSLPRVRRVDMNHQPRKTIFSAPLLQAIRERVARQEQVLILLNRRGYAPVLHCAECGWKSACSHCSAFRVFHKLDRTLRCHHCGFTQRVPRQCPACGNADLGMFGRGTEQLEEQMTQLLGDSVRADGAGLRIARIDADSTRLKGALEQQLAQVHSGEVDVLIGTQMIAKGHDFRRVTLVAALDPDGALFSSDFRAPERLFSLLMQAAGRAGRDARLSLAQGCEMWVQTSHPTHPLFDALKQHDYVSFAEQQLKERQLAGMPPFSAQALVRAEARTQEAAQAYLSAVREAGEEIVQGLQAEGFPMESAPLSLYPAVPMSLQRVANVERAQMLVECPSRPVLQAFLARWHAQLHAIRASHRQVIRWAIDVDPLSI